MTPHTDDVTTAYLVAANRGKDNKWHEQQEHWPVGAYTDPIPRVDR